MNDAPDLLQSAPPEMPVDASRPAPDDARQTAVDRIVARGPRGTFAVAGLATAIVIALYLAFYFFAYLPRGVVQ